MTAIAVVTTDMHSYELPAIHAFAFEHVSKAYADWIEASVG